MALFRIRRPVRLLPGPRLSLRQVAARAPVSSWATQATFDRRAHRVVSGTPTLGKDFVNEKARSMSNPHKQTSVVSLLVAAVLVLWLVLFLLGHH